MNPNFNIHSIVVPNDEVKLRKGFTGADWWWDESGDLQVRIAAELTDWRERSALMCHEISEAIMCRYLGISVERVDDFDSKFKGENMVDVNAGDDPRCPYRLPHTYATAIERIMAGAMQVDWKPYDERLSAL